jgi:hypothetical protein
VSRFAVRTACRYDPTYLLRTWRGYDPGRSGEIQMLQVPPAYYQNHSHSGPWPFLQRVPLLFYGPGHVPSGTVVDRPVTVADMAPTEGALMGFDFPAEDGTVLDEVTAKDGTPPRLVVNVVWDGGGRNVLAEWPQAWPHLRTLMDGGVWFDNATVGSSPSVTPATHTTMATGVFPRRHGITDLNVQVGGKLAGVAEASRYLRVPSLSDRYDLSADNRPLVGMIGNHYLLGMLGRGPRIAGADRDLVAVHSQRSGWQVPQGQEGIYEFPEYVTEVPGLPEAVRALDLEDGRLDGTWLDNAILDDPEEWIVTPAYSRYQTGVVEEIIRREGFGADDVPDLLYVNYKQIDHVAHRFSMNSEEMEQVVRSSDLALGDLVEVLDEEVGEGQWVMVVTADHGAVADTSVTGAPELEPNRLRLDLQARFDPDQDGRDVVQDVRVTQVFLDDAELQENGFDRDDVARFLLGYTLGDHLDDPSLPPDRRDQLVYETAFDGRALEHLDCLPEAS